MADETGIRDAQERNPAFPQKQWFAIPSSSAHGDFTECKDRE